MARLNSPLMAFLLALIEVLASPTLLLTQFSRPEFVSVDASRAHPHKFSILHLCSPHKGLSRTLGGRAETARGPLQVGVPAAACRRQYDLRPTPDPAATPRNVSNKDSRSSIDQGDRKRGPGNVGEVVSKASSMRCCPPFEGAS